MAPVRGGDGGGLRKKTLRGKKSSMECLCVEEALGSPGEMGLGTITGTTATINSITVVNRGLPAQKCISVTGSNCLKASKEF